MKLLALFLHVLSLTTGDVQPKQPFTSMIYFPIQYAPTSEPSPMGHEMAIFPMEQYPDSLQVQIYEGSAMFTCDNGAWYIDEIVDISQENEASGLIRAIKLEGELNSELDIWANNPAVVAAYDYCS